ncbi:class I SAM-dependent methyltransferase [Streptomyces sp. SLBN-31]|uniref:class I SAM-dependent methyltransferase n=1 Tax=Streptomyces sp. SLBN-31 TaxID=2768444 RepID=UPI001154BBCA|nr:class I SAM-dependent methyltransferase [Streptomyces sp. SLBN-31]TQJ86227.1 ubiquinone/menaquinone biosynthesis C-methylase UbiE [Streptomyces sp. SLBN-31]
MDVERNTGDEQAARWNGAAGQPWVESQAVLDGLLRPFEAPLLDAVETFAGPEGRVLDVGCGTGGTTLAAARRLGPAARCVGVDISEPMIAAARERAEREGTAASFVRADAADHAFEPGAFDAVVSRFGVMFFADPVRAFANLRRAAREGAGLRFIAWRGPADNPFMTTAERAAAPYLPDLPVRRPDEPGQFAFADPDRVRSILAQSGWTGIEVQPFDAECTFPEGQLSGYFTRMGPVGQALREADEATRTKVVETVRAAFEPFVHGPEVRFTAGAWLVDAHA